MKKQLLVAIAATTIGVAGIGTTAGVTHALTSDSKSDPMSGLAEAIAKKFNLKSSDVETVINDQRTAHEKEREAEIKTEIDRLVKDGKLTQTQADAINAKRTELQKEREANKPSASESDSDRKTAMEKRKSDLDAWAQQNNISSEYLRYVVGGGHGGPGGPRDQRRE